MDENGSRVQVPPSPVPVQQPVPAQPVTNAANFYPALDIKNIENPKKLLAIPFLGFFVRLIMAIPLYFVFVLLSFAASGAIIATSFYILFKRKYWDPGYAVITAYIAFYIKTLLFLYGLTDKYPGFSFDENGIFAMRIEKPQNPSRLMAFPFVGSLVRIIVLIPYLVYQTVLSNGIRVSVFISWFSVLFRGKYPESLYEFARDQIRVSVASIMYNAFLSDKYPSFRISMNHKVVKILLIVAGILLTIVGTINELNSSSNNYPSQSESSTVYMQEK